MFHGPFIDGWWGGSASVIEIVWTIAAIIGLLRVFPNLREAVLDSEWLRETTAEAGVEPAVQYGVYRQILKATLLLIYLVLGVFAMLIPSTNNAAPGPVGMFTLIILLSAEFIVVAVSELDARERVSVRRAVERALARKDHPGGA